MKKLTYNYVKNKIELANYKLLSKTYKNNHTNLEVQCSEGHTYRAIWINFLKGSRCPYCSNKKKLTYDYIKSQIEKSGYKLLSKRYINNNTRLKVQCSKGHVHKVLWSNFKKSKKCLTCTNDDKKLNYDHVKKQIESVDGYKLLSKEYINSTTKINIQCDNGHNYKTSWHRFQNKNRCSYCNANVSKGEKEVLSLVTSLINETVIENDKTQIINPKTGKHLELDIWMPELRKAIEYNGTYWHSFPSRQNKDMIKIQQCQEKNIDLLVINESDWNINKKQCVDNIKDFINIL